MRDTGAAMSAATARPATVAVVGLGKIGLPLAIQYARHGRPVIGCDINPAVVAGVNAGRSHVQEEQGLEAMVARAVADGELTATDDITAAVRLAGVVVVIVPVAVDAHHEITFASLDAATAAIGAGLQPGTLVVYETTLPVGTTRHRLRALLERASHLRAGDDFALAYSPERVSSGRIFRDLATYPKIVGGLDATSAVAAQSFYRSVLDAEIIEVASTDDAEFVKLIETTYRDVNIALANEYARYADAHGLQIAPAITAANTQPYSHIHQPGIGVGGHCIPVYPHFLLHGAPADGLTLPRQARAINDSMAAYAVERIEAELGSLRDRTVLILGVAYRGDVRETAFSSALLVREALAARGAIVYADDPLYDDDDLAALGYTPFRPGLADEVEAVVVQCDHQAYRAVNFAVLRHCKVVLDGRGGVRRERIEALGMRYIRIGDGQARVPVLKGGRR